MMFLRLIFTTMCFIEIHGIRDYHHTLFSSQFSSHIKTSGRKINACVYVFLVGFVSENVSCVSVCEKVFENKTSKRVVETSADNL